MTIDLSAVPTLTDDLGLFDIPLQRDTFPYAQLQAQGRYPDRSTPNTLPEFLGTLNATDRNFTPDMPSTDGGRNLNVRIAGSDIPIGGGGGGAMTGGASFATGSFDQLASGGDTAQGLFLPDATPRLVYAVWWTVWPGAFVKATGPNGWSIYYAPYATGGSSLILASGAFAGHLTDIHQQGPDNGQMVFPGGLDVSAYNSGATMALFSHTEGGADITGALTLMYSL